MSGIDVSTELIKPLEQLAAERGESVNAIVEQLIVSFLRDQRHLYLHDEMERFRRHHEIIRQQYEGQFVGLRDGQVLDHDADGHQLYIRLRQKYGDLPILIVQVTDQPDQIFTRLGQRIAS